jgi:hypothetical protein
VPDIVLVKKPTVVQLLDWFVEDKLDTGEDDTSEVGAIGEFGARVAYTPTTTIRTATTIRIKMVLARFNDMEPNSSQKKALQAKS